MMIEDKLIEIFEGTLLFIPPPDKVAGWRRSGNIIFLNYKDSLYIIDSGGPSAKSQLVTISKNLLSGKRKPVHCIHTHGHIDHMAGSEQLQKIFNAELWASDKAVPYVESQAPLNLELERESIIVSFRELFTAPSWFVKAAMWVALGRPNTISSVRHLQKSSNIGETGFSPVDLPGHHHGHMGFYNDDKGIFIVGDLIDPRHKMKPILTAPSSDYANMTKSLETVLQIDPDILLTGHGEPIIGRDTIQESILKAKATMQTAQDKVLEILETKTLTLKELSQNLKKMGLGPGDIFRRMFIHSILRYLLNTGKITKQKTSRGKTEFSV